MTGELISLRRFAGALCAWLSLVLFAPVAAYAQASITFADVGTAEVAIVPRLGLVQAEGLNFGTMSKGTNGGTVIVSPLGVRTLGAGSTVVLAGGTVSAAQFDGYGNRNQFICVTIAPVSILRRTTAPVVPLPADLMTVDQFTTGITATSGLGTVGGGQCAGSRYRISRANGLFDFRVGARLTVKPNQNAGHYDGTYLVTTIYN